MRADIEEEENVRVWGEKLLKGKESQANHEMKVSKMETKMNKALEELRVDLVRFLPEESLDMLVQDLMGQFTKIKEKDHTLGEVLTLRIQDKKKIAAAIEKIRDIQKRINMQGLHNKAKNSCITVNIID